jgi:succinate dehydrogenase hydrophobic anchor subunit
LIILGLIGLISAFIYGARTQMDVGALLRWTFFPNPNHVTNTNIPELEPVWVNAFWQVMQMLIIVFGVTHGMNGLRVVVEDFTGQSIWRPLLRGLIFLIWLFAMIVAIYVILAS